MNRKFPRRRRLRDAEQEPGGAGRARLGLDGEHRRGDRPGRRGSILPPRDSQPQPSGAEKVWLRRRLRSPEPPGEAAAQAGNFVPGRSALCRRRRGSRDAGSRRRTPADSRRLARRLLLLLWLLEAPLLLGVRAQAAGQGPRPGSSYRLSSSRAGSGTTASEASTGPRLLPAHFHPAADIAYNQTIMPNLLGHTRTRRMRASRCTSSTRW